jgi:deoxyhypusine synthase
MEKNYKHFNARETLAAAKEYHKFVTEDNGKMMVAMAGAMSTAEIGITLAPMIRAGKVSSISCTGANIEEDLFNLVANKSYKLQPDWRYLTMEQDEKIRDEGMNRVTDTCIPEDVMIEISEALLLLWKEAGEKEESYFHWEYIYQLIRSGFFEGKNDIPMENSWVIAACEMDIPIYTPGVEDSTLGNMFCAYVMQKEVKNHGILKSGTEQFEHLTNWYIENDKDRPIGFFQIGGGIAGDYAMCVVPSILQDHYLKCKRWRYFCHIGDAVTSYGGYSGCPANEKVTWHKLDIDTPNFSINSDASIVAPLIFSYVMEKHLESTAKGIKDSVTEETIGMAAGKKAVEAS